MSEWSDTPKVSGVYWFTEWHEGGGRWFEPTLVSVCKDIFYVLETSDDSEFQGLTQGCDFRVTWPRTKRRWYPVAMPETPEPPDRFTP